MMRRAVPILLALGILSAFVSTLVFLYRKSEARPVVYQTATPRVMDITKKTVAPGAIVPRREVTLKPRVSGIIEKLFVQPGEYVKEKAVIARIQIVPDVVSLNNAEANVKSARISYENARKERERFQKLFDQKLISQTEFNQHQLGFQLRRQELETAQNNLQLVKEGASRGTGKVSNVVHSTVEGMVLEVPVKEGGSVIEANNFNEGTTIAAIADMSDMIFEGHVDESEVGKLEEGMPVRITVGALDEQSFEGKLEYIAPSRRRSSSSRASSSARTTAPTPTSFSSTGPRCWPSTRVCSSSRRTRLSWRSRYARSISSRARSRSACRTA